MSLTSIQAFAAPDLQAVDAVRAVIEEYYGSWFDADSGRMARTIHPDLAKRGWVRESSGDPVLDTDSFDTMVEWTRQGRGRRDGPGERAIEIQVIEVYDDIATALVHTRRYIETLHLVRTAAGWRILNALWRTP
jgi:hypothetical protein